MHLLDEHQTWDPFPPRAYGGDDFDRRDRVDRREAHRAIGVSAIGLALTGLVELAIAALTGSVGLISDALHNLSDVSTSLVVLAGFRISRRPATASHPYGWERAEDLAGLAVALVIWASAALAGYVSIHKLAVHGGTTHLGYGLAAATVGIVGNQLVARYKLRIGRRIQSAALVADGKHSWLDALASAGVFLGLIGVAAGLPWADAVAGLLVTAFIVRVGAEVSGELLHRLMDGVEPELLATAERAALGVDGVAHAHVRARWMGRSLLVEVEGFVAPGTTVEGGEALGRAVEEAVSGAIPNARAVLWSPRALPSAARRGPQ
jgi:cation diffusion facilitator family transporter